MTETPLRLITNSGTWMLILVSTYSTKIFYRSNRNVNIRYSLCHWYVTCQDSIIGIFICSSISLLASLFTRSIMHHPATNSLVTLLARLIMMCITERAQDTSPILGVTNPNLDLCQPNKDLRIYL